MSTKHLACVVLLACIPLFGQSDSSPNGDRNAKSEPLDTSGNGRNACGYEVLNERGIELGTYGDQLVEAVREKWYSIIARSSWGPAKSRTTVIDFVLRQHGELGKTRVEESSGEKSLDMAAWNAIQEGAPFPSKISNFPNKALKLRFYFEYNHEPNAHRPFCTEAPKGVYRAGGSVEAPRVLYQPDPEYSEEARKKKRQGAVTLRLIVGADDLTSDVCVLRAAGSGLDEKAVEAVKAWRFEPGTKDGLPVPVLLSVDTTFRLY
jgi:TonB family protein